VQAKRVYEWIKQTIRERMINTKIGYVVQVLHNSIVDDDISVQLLLLSKKKNLFLSMYNDHHSSLFSDTFNIIFKVIRLSSCLFYIILHYCVCIDVHRMSTHTLCKFFVIEHEHTHTEGESKRALTHS
jgi:hypothetical protein